MSPEVITLRERALKARALYLYGEITRKQAQVEIKPYIDACNEKSKELAKKYNQKPKLISFAAFVR